MHPSPPYTRFLSSCEYCIIQMYIQTSSTFHHGGKHADSGEGGRGWTLIGPFRKKEKWIPRCTKYLYIFCEYISGFLLKTRKLMLSRSERFFFIERPYSTNTATFVSWHTNCDITSHFTVVYRNLWKTRWVSRDKTVMKRRHRGQRRRCTRESLQWMSVQSNTTINNLNLFDWFSVSQCNFFFLPFGTLKKKPCGNI